jgi:predicted nuclease of predicted toxin-antitoxin system
MIRFLADENFNNHIIRGVRLRNKNIDIVRLQDRGLSGVADPTVLDFALKENRILLTHDLETIPKFAYERVNAGQKIPAIILVKKELLIAQVIEEILLICECCDEIEFREKIFYLPL